MRRGWPAAWMLVLMSLGASAAEPPATPAGPDVVIRLERGPCFGSCPVYSVTVLGDGSVTFIGKRFVASPGVHKAQLEEADYRRLVDAVDELGILKLDGDYSVHVTDMPTAFVTVVMPAGAMRIRHYGSGCAPPAGAGSAAGARATDNAPAALCRFERMIDEIAGTARWVGKR